MTRRDARSSFVPYAYVFPGGKIDAADASPEAASRTLGLQADRLTGEFRASAPAELPHEGAPLDTTQMAALCVAALRELFEEAGILLARTSDGTFVEGAAVLDDAVQAQRDNVRGGTIAFDAFLASRGWYADARELAYFSHWITPPSEPRRYDTHFFLARAPQDQAGAADAYETHDGIWIAPQEALARYKERKLHLVYPTIKHLERLSGFTRVDDLLAFARQKPVVTIMPTGSPYDYFKMPQTLEGVW